MSLWKPLYKIYSIKHLFPDGCTVLFFKNKRTFIRFSDKIMQGRKNLVSGIPLAQLICRYPQIGTIFEMVGGENQKVMTCTPFSALRTLCSRTPISMGDWFKVSSWVLKTADTVFPCYLLQPYIAWTKQKSNQIRNMYFHCVLPEVATRGSKRPRYKIQGR